MFLQRFGDPEREVREEGRGVIEYVGVGEGGVGQGEGAHADGQAQKDGQDHSEVRQRLSQSSPTIQEIKEKPCQTCNTALPTTHYCRLTQVRDGQLWRDERREALILNSTPSGNSSNDTGLIKRCSLLNEEIVLLRAC